MKYIVNLTQEIINTLRYCNEQDINAYAAKMVNDIIEDVDIYGIQKRGRTPKTAVVLPITYRSEYPYHDDKEVDGAVAMLIATVQNRIAETTDKHKPAKVKKVTVDDKEVDTAIDMLVDTLYSKYSESGGDNIDDIVDDKEVDTAIDMLVDRLHSEHSESDDVKVINDNDTEESVKVNSKKKSKKVTVTLNEMSTKDLKNLKIDRSEIRGIVKKYYDVQDFRIISGNQASALSRAGIDGGEFYNAYTNSFREIENATKTVLTNCIQGDPVAQWCMSICGIGPVLAAGLVSYIDISKCQTAGAIWKYAGIDTGNRTRKRGEKLGYNPEFKKLCWKIGQSFIKVSSKESDIYGKLYLQKKAEYIARNEAGGFAETARAEMESGKKYAKTTEAYKAYSTGKIPDARIVQMAARFATKIFLSHLFTLWYELYNGVPAPKPFVEAHLGHVHIIAPPNREVMLGK